MFTKKLQINVIFELLNPMLIESHSFYVKCYNKRLNLMVFFFFFLAEFTSYGVKC